MIDEWKLDNMDKFIYSDYEGKHLEIDAIEDCFKKIYTFFKKKFFFMSRNIDTDLRNLFSRLCSC